VSLLIAFWNLMMIIVRFSPMQVQRLKQMGATVRNSTLYKETLEKRSQEESHLRKTFQALSTEALQATIENHRSMLALAEEVLEQRRRGLAAFSVKE
jgi:predicted metal-dependent hydrolase